MQAQQGCVIRRKASSVASCLILLYEIRLTPPPLFIASLLAQILLPPFPAIIPTLFSFPDFPGVGLFDIIDHNDVAGHEGQGRELCHS